MLNWYYNQMTLTLKIVDLPRDQISSEQSADYEFCPVHGWVGIGTVSHVNLLRMKEVAVQ